MLVALNTISCNQSTATTETKKAVSHILDYVSTHSNTVIRYHTRGMCIHIDSDASYLSVKKTRSRSGGYFYLSDEHSLATPPVRHKPNGVLHAECKMLRNGMASATEAELGALFHNGQVAEPIRTCLAEMGYPQPNTSLKTNKSTAAGIINSSIRQKKSKAVDMRFYWIKDRVSQKHFLVFWESGMTNKGDYYTKHFPVSHHVHVRSQYVYK